MMDYFKVTAPIWLPHESNSSYSNTTNIRSIIEINLAQLNYVQVLSSSKLILSKSIQLKTKEALNGFQAELSQQGHWIM